MMHAQNMPVTNTAGERAAKYLRSVANTVLEKGQAYGNSVGDPVRIFSKSDQKEGLKVRIDDKLSRIARGDPSKNNGEDVIRDLIGYLALLAVSELEQKKDPNRFVNRRTPTRFAIVLSRTASRVQYRIEDPESQNDYDKVYEYPPDSFDSWYKPCD